MQERHWFVVWFSIFSSEICLFSMSFRLRNLRPLLKLLSSSKDTTWLRLTKLVISAADTGSSRVHCFSHAAWSLAGKEVRVMEVIKIPREHVDPCLFFRPRREGGELPRRCTVLLSASRRVDTVLERRRTWWRTKEMKDRWGEEWAKQRTDGQRDRRMEAEWKGLKEGNGGRRDEWMETVEGERQTPSTWCQTKSRTNERWGFSEPYTKKIRDGWIAGGDREEGREGRTEINGYILSNCQVKFRQTFKMSQKSKFTIFYWFG